MIAALSASVLGCFGVATSSGTRLAFNKFHAVVGGSCDGVQPICLFIAAVLAFPCRWRDKALGLILGIPAVLLVNLIRVQTIMVVGAYWPESVDWVHLYGWQALVIVLTVAIWLFWEEQVARPKRVALR